MGDYEAARPYYEKALEIRREVLGQRHPSTATSLNNLGVLCYYQGQLNEAIDFIGQALAIEEVVLGANHPSTKSTRDNLAFLTSKQTK
ncbi:tetratricopeptide repeat protein [Anaerolineales bacterium HSG24]|nr:tetratricopeptide repeat protein [Anaerolineales bacterium HSG24]